MHIVISLPSTIHATPTNRAKKEYARLVCETMEVRTLLDGLVGSLASPME
jgi:hypothetical protein